MKLWSEKGGHSKYWGCLLCPPFLLPGGAFSSLAVGVTGEGPDPEVDDMLAGGIAVEDLEQEQVDGGGRIEDAVAPAMADGLAGVGDGLGAEAGGEVLPEA